VVAFSTPVAFRGRGRRRGGYVAAVLVVVSALLCVFLSPWLAGLTLSVPDRGERRWWVGRRPSAKRLAVTAGVAVVLGTLAGLGRQPAFVGLAICVTPLVVIDVEHHRLPDRLVAAAGVGGVALLALSGQWVRWLAAVGAAASLFAVLAAFALVAQFGFGDVKLGAVLALYTGWFGWGCVLSGVLLGFVLGGVVAFVLMVVRRAGRKSAIAFGPWLVLGAFAAPLLA
jgi:leader peptidase (prepilin peptidase)/N-methyltransferase